MHTIPAEYKKMLFNKEPNEPVTAEEQEAWDEYAQRELDGQKLTEQVMNMDEDAILSDPAFKIAWQRHQELEPAKEAQWEKFKANILPKYLKPKETTEEDIENMRARIIAKIKKALRKGGFLSLVIFLSLSYSIHYSNMENNFKGNRVITIRRVFEIITINTYQP